MTLIKSYRFCDDADRVLERKAMTKSYWMLVDSVHSFRKAKEHDFKVHGVKALQLKKVQRMAEGDQLLFYLFDLKKFGATAILTSSIRESTDPPWDIADKDDYQYRISIKPEVVLEEDKFIDAFQIGPSLQYLKRWPPESWPLAFIGYLHLIPKLDFLLIEEEMKKINRNRKSSGRNSFSRKS